MIKKWILIVMGVALISPNEAIVPLPGVDISAYEAAGKQRKNVGRLITYKDGGQVGTCTVTLIGQRNGVGIAITAGHCVDDYNISAEKFEASGGATELPKCPLRAVSFEPENTDVDPNKVPVIGAHAVSRFINNSKLFKGDLAVVFLDLSKKYPPLENTKLDDSFSEDDVTIPNAEVVGYGKTELIFEKEMRGTQLEVVGYGQKHFLEGLNETKRRSMLTGAILHRGNENNVTTNQELRMLLDSAEAQPAPGLPPVGKSPAQGDSGGPIIDLDHKHIVGVVSFATSDQSGKNVVFALPIYPYLDWLNDQMGPLLNSMVVTPKSPHSLMSNPAHWSTSQPLSICGHYGELKRIVEVGVNQEVIADTEVTPYAVLLKGDNSKLRVQGGARKLENLRIEGNNVTIASENGATLTLADLEVSKPIKVDSALHIERAFNITKGADVNSNKLLRISDAGIVNIVPGAHLTVNGVVFDDRIQTTITSYEAKLRRGQKLFTSAEIPNPGIIKLEGELTSATPIHHFAHTLLINAKSPGIIHGDYALSSGGGHLRIDLTQRSAHDSTPLLRVKGDATIGGALEFNYTTPLKIGDELTIVEANRLKIDADVITTSTSISKNYKLSILIRPDIPLTERGARLQIDESEPNKLKLKVVPSSGGVGLLSLDHVEIEPYLH